MKERSKTWSASFCSAFLVYSNLTMRVLKFGGSSLATSATVRAVGAIVLEARRREPVIVVVSAFEGVTNQLIECARDAERGDSSYEQKLEDISRRHRTSVAAL